MTVRVGVIGCGGMGSWHAHNLARQPGVSVAAVADVVSDAAEALADSLGATVADAAALAVGDGVDAILIASSDETHAEFATAAIAAGLPCFLEKPLGATLDQAQLVLDAEVSSETRLVRVGFMREVDPAHRQLAEITRELGEMTKVRCVHRNVDPELRSIDVIFAQSLIHDVHTVRWLTGEEMVAVDAFVATRADGYRDILLVGELTGGGIAQLEFEDQAFAYEVHVEVTGVGGMAATLPHPRAVARRDLGERLHVGADWFGRFEDAYRIEIDEWAACLRGESAPQGPSVWDGYAAQVVVAAGVRSVADGSTRIELPDRPEIYAP